MLVYHRCLCYIFNQATMDEDQEFIWTGASFKF